MKSVPKNAPKICGVGQTCPGGVHKPEWDSVRNVWRNLIFSWTTVGEGGRAGKQVKEGMTI